MSVAAKDHMDLIAQLPCVLGIALGESHGPAKVHHIREGQGLSQRASDWLTIPLCYDCHQGPMGIHGDRRLLKIARVTELELLAFTIRLVTEALCRA